MSSELVRNCFTAESFSDKPAPAHDDVLLVGQLGRLVPGEADGRHALFRILVDGDGQPRKSDQGNVVPVAGNLLCLVAAIVFIKILCLAELSCLPVHAV